MLLLLTSSLEAMKTILNLERNNPHPNPESTTEKLIEIVVSVVL
jgi:hypothetical protein